MVKLVRGENDLATLYPDLVNEWHPTKKRPELTEIA